MNPIRDLLEQASCLLRDAAGTDARLGTLTDDELLEVMARTEQAGRLVDALRTLTAATVDDRSRYSLGADSLAHRHGHSKAVHLIEHTTGVSQREAARRVRVGFAILPRETLDALPLPARFPQIAAAMTCGSLGVDAAEQIIRCLTQAGNSNAHHVIEHEYGGKTEIDNGCLLCPAHHRLLHRTDFTLSMINGRPHVLAPKWSNPDDLWQPLGRSRVMMSLLAGTTTS